MQNITFLFPFFQMVTIFFCCLFLAPVCESNENDFFDNRTVLHFGAFYPLSGPFSSWGKGCLPAAELAVRHINHRKDVLKGYRIQLTNMDTQVGPVFKKREFTSETQAANDLAILSKLESQKTKKTCFCFPLFRFSACCSQQVGVSFVFLSVSLYFSLFGEKNHWKVATSQEAGHVSSRDRHINPRFLVWWATSLTHPAKYLHALKSFQVFGLFCVFAIFPQQDCVQAVGNSRACFNSKMFFFQLILFEFCLFSECPFTLCRQKAFFLTKSGQKTFFGVLCGVFETSQFELCWCRCVIQGWHISFFLIGTAHLCLTAA